MLVELTVGKVVDSNKTNLIRVSTKHGTDADLSKLSSVFVVGDPRKTALNAVKVLAASDVGEQNIFVPGPNGQNLRLYHVEFTKLDPERLQVVGRKIANHIQSCEEQRTGRWFLYFDVPFNFSLDDALFGLLVNLTYTEPGKINEKINITSLDPHFQDTITRTLKMTECVNLARRLSVCPANLATPEKLAATIQRLSRENGLHYKEVGKDKLKTLGAGGILSVASGSENAPVMTVVSYVPKHSYVYHLVLLGKGITFDTGGTNLKHSRGMEGMHMDKTGAVVSTLAVVACELMEVPVRVTAVCPLAENMLGSGATRPSDIVQMMNGKRVEITNTDAEGRVCLADALTYVQRHLSVAPTHLISVATLTGSVEYALGSIRSGLMYTDKNLMKYAIRASREMGERLWPLMIDREVYENLKSPVADLDNSSGGPGAQVGGAFIFSFLENKIPMLHMDIAGTAKAKDHPVFPSGPIAPMLRTIVRMAQGM